MRDAAATVARHPHPLTIHAAGQFAATAVLLHESVESGEQFRH
jgi:hypothetical protein